VPGDAEPRGTARFVRRAFALMRRERPARYRAIAAVLRDAPGRYRVERERFTLRARSAREVEVRQGWPPDPAAVVAETTARATLQLVDGTATVEQLLERELLVVYGSADALLALSSVLRMFADAAVASRAQQRLFEAYRTWVLRSGSAGHPAQRRARL